VTATATSTFAGTVSNFEVLSLGAVGATSAINMTNADGINRVIVAGGAAALNISNAAENFTLTQTALTDTASSIVYASTTGTNTVNLNFSAGDGFTNAAAYTIAGVEVLNITTLDTTFAASVPTAVFVAPITAAAATTVTVSGNVGINLTGLTATTLTSLNASGLTYANALGGLTWTSGALAAASNITGSAGGTNVVTTTAAVGAVTYTGGTGIDTITGANAANNTVNLGNGANSFTIAAWTAGNSNITGGSGIDQITTFGGADTISAGGGNDVITSGAGADVIDGGDGVDTFAVGTTMLAASIEGAGTGTSIGTVINLSSSAVTAAALNAASLTAVTPAGVFIAGSLASVAAGSAVYTFASNSNLFAATADTLTNIESDTGSNGRDFIYAGAAGGGVLNGGAGADRITLGAGIDTVVAGAVGQSIVASAEALTNGGIANADTLTFGNGLDVIIGFVSGVDKIDVAVAATAATSGIGLAATTDLVDTTTYSILGTYDAATGIFTVNSAATATTANVATLLVVGDAGATTFETSTGYVMLVGVASTVAADFI
jgi:S-layer protein